MERLDISMTLPEASPFLKTKMTNQAFVFRAVLFLAVTVTVLCMILPGVKFPWGYHNDEPSKVQQIQSGERNLRHPPLMLTLTDVLVSLTGNRENAQSTVETGRLLSAFCMALASAFLVDWAFCLVHPFAGVCLALCMPFRPGFFEVGHYFKEDALFLLGVAASIRALAFWISKPGNFSSALLGLSLATLAGSKYVGWFLVLIIAVQVYMDPSSRQNKVRLLVFFFSSLVVVYWPVFTRMGTWKFFLSDEITLLFAGDYGAGFSVPHTLYWKQLCHNFSLTLIILGTSLYVAGVLKRKLRGFWIMPFTCVFTMCCLAWTSKYSDRYLLPVLLMGMPVLVCGPVLAFMALMEHRSGKRWFLPALFLCGFIPAMMLVFIKWDDFQQLNANFRRDSRRELVAWMKGNLDSNKVLLAEDTLAKIDDPAFDPKTWRSYFVADLGSIGELKSYGITHVVISYDVYHRFVARNVVSGEAGKELFEKRKTFYREILKTGKLVWSSEAQDPKALHPGLKLIELP